MAAQLGTSVENVADAQPVQNTEKEIEGER
jgi:hypothetical protein